MSPLILRDEICLFCSKESKELNQKNNNQMDDINLTGSKGYHLLKMYKLGIKVPEGFVITSNVCKGYYENKKNIPDDFITQIIPAVSEIERASGLKFGVGSDQDGWPLLLSVRSGSMYSMPGMMNTVLNLGLNEEIVSKILQKGVVCKRFVLDTFLRFIKSYYSSVFLTSDSVINDALVETYGCDVSTPNNSIERVLHFKNLILSKTGKKIPEDIWCQLKDSIRAVFDSWSGSKAVSYRGFYKINEKNSYTAVTVQRMVFGNKDENSATGVVFTRNPSNGENILFGEFIRRAQGEDIVSGSKTPKYISSELSGEDSFEFVFPKTSEELKHVVKSLEREFKDVQDVEFTVEGGELWILQSRKAKRTPLAQIKIACDLYKEGIISKEEAIMSLPDDSMSCLFSSSIKDASNLIPDLIGLPASGGAFAGKVVFKSSDAETLASKGEKVVLIRSETNPEDILGICAAGAVLTSRGGTTSHAAVVARGMCKTCVCGANDLFVHEDEGYAIIKKANKVEIKIEKHDEITVDGTSGFVYIGKKEIEEKEVLKEIFTILDLVSSCQNINVKANADTANDFETAKCFGASGIGLCRTEHMFFETQKLDIVRKLIIQHHKKENIDPLLKELTDMQTKDFEQLFISASDMSLNIRLLDPPLHEFLVDESIVFERLAKDLSISISELKSIFESIKETNPMLGTRGARLGIVFPEIYKAQINAIFFAYKKLLKRDIDFNISLEIMVPFIFSAVEMEIMRNLIKKIESEVFSDMAMKPKYSIGSMIELPRSAFVADKIALNADFFSFGTNDLTQTTFGISRDDSYKFIGSYKNSQILKQDPFVELDIEGVGELIRIACEKGRSTNKNIGLCICGEQASFPSIVEFLNNIGIDSISCSVYKVPTMKLVIAKHNIKRVKDKTCSD